MRIGYDKDKSKQTGKNKVEKQQIIPTPCLHGLVNITRLQKKKKKRLRKRRMEQNQTVKYKHNCFPTQLRNRPLCLSI